MSSEFIAKPVLVSLIAAMSPSRVIGCDGDLPWHLPEDLAHFKATTLGLPVIMGRVTWESIGRPLPGRRNLVVSRSVTELAGAEVLDDLGQAVEAAGTPTTEWPDPPTEIMIIGGAQIYRAALATPGLVDRMYLTEVEISAEADADLDGDCWFPEFDQAEWDGSLLRRLEADGDRPALSFRLLSRSD